MGITALHPSYDSWRPISEGKRGGRTAKASV
jgi:hypothetical protein